MFFPAKSVKSGLGLEPQEHGHGRQGPPHRAMATWVARVSPSALQRSGAPESLPAQQGRPAQRRPQAEPAPAWVVWVRECWRRPRP